MKEVSSAQSDSLPGKELLEMSPKQLHTKDRKHGGDVDASDSNIEEPEANFASIDVRETAKVIEKAKIKTLGDFLVPTKVSQGQLKKKKKLKPAGQ